MLSARSLLLGNAAGPPANALVLPSQGLPSSMRQVAQEGPAAAPTAAFEPTGASSERVGGAHRHRLRDLSRGTRASPPAARSLSPDHLSSALAPSAALALPRALPPSPSLLLDAPEKAEQPARPLGGNTAPEADAGAPSKMTRFASDIDGPRAAGGGCGATCGDSSEAEGGDAGVGKAAMLGAATSLAGGAPLAAGCSAARGHWKSSSQLLQMRVKSDLRANFGIDGAAAPSVAVGAGGAAMSAGKAIMLHRALSNMTGHRCHGLGVSSGALARKELEWDPLKELEWAQQVGREKKRQSKSALRRASQLAKARKAKREVPYVPLLDRDKALCLFYPEHPIRRLATKVTASRAFDNGVLFLIIVSSACLAIPSLQYPSIETRCLVHADAEACAGWTALETLDDVFTACFALEAVLKVLSLGFVLPLSTAYLSDPWNVLDFGVVLVSVIDVAFFKYSTSQDQQGLESLKMLRAMRCLRPLRMISRLSGMRMVVNSLLKALPGVVNVVLVMLSLMLIFGILGVQLFSGRFEQCALPSVRTSRVCDQLASHWRHSSDGLEWQSRCVATAITHRATCERLASANPAYAWLPPAFGSFDSVPDAMLLLFEMSGLEGWPTVMYHGMDVVGIDVAPRRDANTPAFLFFLAWIFIEAFCVNNLVVGVIVANFQDEKVKQDSFMLMTKGQREWVDTMLRTTKLAPRRTYRPETPRRAALWELVRHNYFELFIQMVIISNVAVMTVYYCEPRPALQWSAGVGQGACVLPDWSQNLQTYANYVFTAIYLVEMFLKLVAYGRAYFYYAWNLFDFALVLSSLVDVGLDVAYALDVLDANGIAFSPVTLRVLKTVRMGRLLRLVRHLSRLRTLIVAFVSALPAFANIIALLFILLFVYAVLGVSLFADVPFGEYVTEHSNLRTLPAALLTLFSSVTGENWNGIMHECMSANVGGIAALPFFALFHVMAGFVLLNLVIAVILENYGQSVDDSLREVPQEVLFNYREEWERLDPYARGNIDSENLMLLLRRVREPLGFKRADGSQLSRDAQLKFMAQLRLHDHGGKVNFQVMLQALTSHAHLQGKFAESAAADGSELPNDVLLQARLLKQLKAALRAAHAYELAPPRFTQAELHAALTLQAAWRGYKTKQKADANRRGGVLSSFNKRGKRRSREEEEGRQDSQSPATSFTRGYSRTSSRTRGVPHSFRRQRSTSSHSRGQGNHGNASLAELAREATAARSRRGRPPAVGARTPAEDSSARSPPRSPACTALQTSSWAAARVARLFVKTEKKPPTAMERQLRSLVSQAKESKALTDRLRAAPAAACAALLRAATGTLSSTGRNRDSAGTSDEHAADDDPHGRSILVASGLGGSEIDGPPDAATQEAATQGGAHPTTITQTV